MWYHEWNMSEQKITQKFIEPSGTVADHELDKDVENSGVRIINEHDQLHQIQKEAPVIEGEIGAQVAKEAIRPDTSSGKVILPDEKIPNVTRRNIYSSFSGGIGQRIMNTVFPKDELFGQIYEKRRKELKRAA